MEKIFIHIFIIIIVFLATASEAFDCKPSINKLDYRVITSKLPVIGKEKSKSDNGRIRQRWTIQCVNGNSCGQIETIGNNQKDVDKVCWTCREYDKNGSRIKPINNEKFCHQFFIRVLTNVIDCPGELANQLIIQGETMNPQPAIYNIKNSDISIETDGEYYALRRKSRFKNDLSN